MDVREELKIAPDIHALIAELRPNSLLHVSFQPGKLGRVDRFVLRRGNPGRPPIELMEFITDPDDGGTCRALQILDDMVDADPAFAILYNNPRSAKYAYCLWERHDDRKDWATVPKILPLYQKRLDERQRIYDGTLKRGHKEFGFYPLDGFR
jgi:hypothetical protein